ncbi:MULTISPECIES: DUF2721 domain-containing protein [Halomonas]|uniref:DUF2721 domain-containing protein n=1 Tax=Halomonas halophila TaxID=29573 RepID=A0ABQ0U5V4_9GAMM|nr:MULTISPECIES: DUF2721 domain-containing protein [Halomonas]MDR5890823.1 DUF2721 domain-containing protein [Halomonas salina]RAH39515.1 DUF2721 domain-containing protein [Halomonas sp. SL1]WJY06500.1 DUF2721 domain-containing protein [Halomonas halophila]GEK73787.1 DUF2721 domain-containing protein [Halomonas halophila]
MTLTTPALLFPAISLLLLAYTNRFLTLAQLIRKLAEEDRDTHHEVAARQILMLRKRITLTKRMQMAGVSSFLLCTLSMFALFLSLTLLGMVLFGISLITLSVSLCFSLWEVKISTNALNVQLQDLEVLNRHRASGAAGERDDSDDTPRDL